MILAFNKPYGVLSQFTKQEPGHRTLAEFGFPKRIYPLGRLDWDSEGLLLLFMVLTIFVRRMRRG